MAVLDRRPTISQDMSYLCSLVAQQVWTGLANYIQLPHLTYVQLQEYIV